MQPLTLHIVSSNPRTYHRGFKRGSTRMAYNDRAAHFFPITKMAETVTTNMRMTGCALGVLGVGEHDRK